MNKSLSETLIKEFEEIQKQQLEILKNKNADYSWQEAFRNFDMVENLQICSAEAWLMVRITDKLTRASNLLKREAKVKDEKIEDTLLDAMNYLWILLVYLKTKNIIKDETDFMWDDIEKLSSVNEFFESEDKILK